MRYTTIRCPNCKKFIQIMKPNNWSYSDHLGDPIAYCNFCSKPYKTGRKKWLQMNDNEKSKLKRSTYLHALVSAFWFTMLLVIISTLIFDFVIQKIYLKNWLNTFFTENIGIIVFVVFAITYYFAVRIEKQILAEKIAEN